MESPKKPELKPCPFCGDDAELKIEEDHHGEFYSFGCSNTLCIAHNIKYTADSEYEPPKDAIAEWNTRSE